VYPAPARGVLSVGKAVYGHTVRIVDSSKRATGELRRRSPIKVQRSVTTAIQRGAVHCVTVGYALGDLGHLQWAALHHWKSEGNGYRQWQKLYPQDIEQLVKDEFIKVTA